MDMLGLSDLVISLFRIVGVIFTVLLIIFVHELGHYLVGRWCKIKAITFSLGFGPEIFSFKDRHGTCWRLALIPLGGYVRFLGDGLDDENNKSVGGDEGHFNKAAAWKRALTVFAGPLFNALFSLFILALFLFFYGQVIIKPIVGAVQTNSPAYAAGIKKGDQFLSVDGSTLNSFEELMLHVSTHAGQKLNFSILRDGKSFDTIVIPTEVTNTDRFGNKYKIGVIGVTPPLDPNNKKQLDKRFIVTQNYNIFSALRNAGKELVFIVEQTVRVMGRLLIGEGDRCQLSGPTKTVNIAWQISGFGFLSLLKLAAFLSIGIATINLFPLPPLDGGHLFFYLWESVFGRPVPLSIKDLFFKIGFIIVFAFIIFSIINDYLPC